MLEILVEIHLEVDVKILQRILQEIHLEVDVNKIRMKTIYLSSFLISTII